MFIVPPQFSLGRSRSARGPLVALAAVGALLAASGTASALPAYGLTSSGAGIVGFDTGAVGALTSNVAVSGLAANESLITLDARPKTGQLYALSNQNRLYLVNPITGAATAVLAPGATPFTLNGSVGMDFNPAADRIRVTTSTGQNLRLNPDTGGLAADDSAANGLIRYDAGDPNAAITPRVVTVAYTNSVLGGPAPAGTQTTMYAFDIQTGLDRRLVTQGSINATPVSPNLGRLFTVAPVFGFIAGDDIGFDIARVGSTDLAFLSGQTFIGTTLFYTLDLANGNLVSQGAIGGGAVQVRDFTIVPAPGAAAILGLAGLGVARRRRR